MLSGIGAEAELALIELEVATAPVIEDGKSQNVAVGVRLQDVAPDVVSEGRLGPLLAAHPDDGPALLLLTRAVQALQPNATPFNPVWVLPGK